MVTPVPAGVCNLSITEMKPSKNYFGKKETQTRRENNSEIESSTDMATVTD